MSLSKMRLIQLGGVAVFLICVAFLVASFSAQVKVTVTPSDAKADGLGYGASHISGMFIPDESGQKLGGSSAPSLVGNCFEINGTTECYYGSAWSQSTSSVCMFKLPGATSTLQTAVAQVKNQQGTADIGEWGYSKNDVSTSTSLGFGVLSATVQTVIVASSTGSGVSGVNPAFVMPPNAILQFKTGSTTPTGRTGRCSAQVQVI